ncbi:MAG: MFS transporter [Chloroflexota bacterium]
MRNFLTIWFGQTISSIGSKMTGFAIGIWIFEQTGQATALVLTGVFAAIPTLILTLFSGIIVDRVNRKRLMMVGDTVAGCSTIVLLLLVVSGQLQIWHLYLAYAINAPFDTLQGLAYQSSVALMVSKEQYARVGGMTTLTWYGGNILSPVFAATLYALGGLVFVMLVDIVTFVVAIITVIISHIPQPERSTDETQDDLTLWQQLQFGFRYIWERPPLRAFIFVACLWTLFHDAAMNAPMILARTNNNEAALAAVSAASGVGGVIAALLVSVWGGPKRHMLTYAWGMISAGIGKTLVGIGQNVASWSLAQGYTSANFPFLGSARQAIVMSKVAPSAQGRFFATFTIIVGLVSLSTRILAGLLGDYVFEPAMTEGGWLTPYLSWIFGTGNGAGFSVQFVLLGLGMTGVGVLALTWKRVRNIETELPDHDEKVSDN